MSGDDITFRVDLDISRAEAKLSELDNDINNTLSKTSNNDGDFAMADAVFARNVSRSAHQENNSKFTFAIDKFSNAVDRLKDKFRNVGTGKKGDGETNYEFLKMKHDSGRAVDVLDDEGGMTEAVFNRIVHEQARLDSIKKIEAVDAGEFGAYDLSKGWSQEGSDAYTKFRLMQERAMAKKEMKLYDDMGYEDGARGAAERFAKADGALRADRLKNKVDSQGIKQDEVTDETKQQNREYTEQIFKLGKIFALLTAIKGVLSAARKLGGAVIDTVTNNTNKTKQEYSLLTVDPLGASRSSTDRLNAMMLEGTRNLGADSPFSKDDWLGFLTTIQTTKEDALTGKVNSDMAIAFQWLTKLGTGFNAEQLLTGDPTRTNAEIAKQMADAIEKALSSDAFWNQDEVSRSQTLKYLREALGENIVNGIWYNASINKITGEDRLATDRILEHGGSANVNDATPISTRKINDALAELSDAVSLLSKTFQNTFEPAITLVINKLTGFADWLQGKIAMGSKENREKRKVQFYKTVDEIDKVIEMRESGRIKTDIIHTDTSRNWQDRSRDVAEEVTRLPSVRKINDKYGKEINEMGNNPKSIADMFTAMVMAMPTTGTSQWFNEVAEPFVLQKLAQQMEGKELAVNEHDSHGNVKTSVNPNLKRGWQKDLAQLIIDSSTSTKVANSMSAEEILSLLNHTEKGIELVNKYFNEGNAFDFDEKDPMSFAKQYEKIFGEKGSQLAMLEIMSMIANSKDQSKYSGVYTSVTPDQQHVYVHVETTNNGTKTETVVPVVFSIDEVDRLKS